jgi:hypothetical protein
VVLNNARPLYLVNRDLDGRDAGRRLFARRRCAEGRVQPTLVVYFPPWVVLAALLGLLHGAIFHLLLGQRLSHLPRQLAIGLVGSLTGGLIGIMIPPAMLAIGDTNLIATTATAWAVLGIARVFRFC